MKTIEGKEYTLTFDDSPEAREKLFQEFIKYAIETKTFSGEDYCQSDGAMIGANDLIPAILDDVLKMEVTYKD